MIYGASGVGKTFSTINLIHRIAYDEKEIWKVPKMVFANMPKLLIQIRNSFSNKANENDLSELQIIDSLTKKVDCLILDDLGSEKISEWTLQTLYVIINECENEGIQLIITTNYTAEELTEKISERVVNRIMGLCRPINMKGENKRAKYKDLNV